MLLKYIPQTFLILNSVLLGVFLAPAVQANGGHFLVDDASISASGDCLLESWLTRQGEETTGMLMPSCGLSYGWDISVPLELHASDGSLLGYGVEAKTLLSELWMGGGLAFSLGGMLDHNDQSLQVAFINMPYSREINDHAVLHLNIGAEYEHADRDWRATWGVASTLTLGEATDFIAEVAGAGADRPTSAVGLRYAWHVGVELDASIARDFELRANLISLGLNWAF